ncbi:hypothetical protein ROK90_21315 [Cronobacter dublinensis]|nr:hypothetical protein [Cronobacter dublinensis]MDT3668515.1 hypothetical protein [Cronobacter dublinensis]WEP47528.1 hypothetical protein NNQ27_00505 [Cronobacter dublinensis]
MPRMALTGLPTSGVTSAVLGILHGSVSFLALPLSLPPFSLPAFFAFTASSAPSLAALPSAFTAAFSALNADFSASFAVSLTSPFVALAATIALPTLAAILLALNAAPPPGTKFAAAEAADSAALP